VQAYCDLLEVRWLLSERAGRDVGSDAALAALAARTIPVDAVATMAVAEAPTAELPRFSAGLLDEPTDPVGGADSG
jgi:hypothetical protein